MLSYEKPSKENPRRTGDHKLALNSYQQNTGKEIDADASGLQLKLRIMLTYLLLLT